MHHMKALLPALVILLPAGAAADAGRQPFDGVRQTAVSCVAIRDALGYSFRFLSTVKDGVLNGPHRTAGQPSSLQIDGTIAADETGRPYAIGRTGSKEFVPGRDTPRGTEYSYNIVAHFIDSTGTGTRVEGRPCSFEFVKQ